MLELLLANRKTLPNSFNHSEESSEPILEWFQFPTSTEEIDSLVERFQCDMNDIFLLEKNWICFDNNDIFIPNYLTLYGINSVCFKLKECSNFELKCIEALLDLDMITFLDLVEEKELSRLIDNERIEFLELDTCDNLHYALGKALFEERGIEEEIRGFSDYFDFEAYGYDCAYEENWFLTNNMALRYKDTN